MERSTGLPMTSQGSKYAVLRDEERPALLAHCAQHLVGFVSNTNTAFYGSGVIVDIQGVWAIATAAGAYG